MKTALIIGACLFLSACNPAFEQAAINAGAQAGSALASIECAKLKKKSLAKMCRTAAGAIVTVAAAQSAGLVPQ